MRLPRLAEVSSSGLTAVILLFWGLTVGAAEDVRTYELDKAHSRIGFEVGHLGISTVSGEFKDYTGTVEFKPGKNGVLAAQATIEVDSVDTGIEARDEHLLKDDFFAAEDHPQITFDAPSAKRKGDKWMLKGEFTMRGTTKKITIPMTVKGPIEDPWGNSRIGLQGELKIDRHEYGVGSDKMSDKLVGKEVTLKIALEATARKTE